MTINYQLPNFVHLIIDTFNNHKSSIFIVGGAVRDILMNKPPTDWDFATIATPEQILRLFPQGFYDNKFGTVGIPLEKLAISDEQKPPQQPSPINYVKEKNVIEITTFRTEQGYSDKRRPDLVAWGQKLEEDLARRDFTINAMALTPQWSSYSPDSQSTLLELIDPFGGQEDLIKLTIRAVGDPNQRFDEDALRMLRAIRIACQLQFQIEPNTLQAIANQASLIKHVSGERIRDELFKILSTDFFYEGILLLRNSGLLAQILPEFDKGFGVEQFGPQRHHIYDVGTHGLMSLRHCPSKKPLVRFATLIHDIGKPQVVGKDDRGNTTFYNHEVVGATIAKNIAERLRLSRKEKEKLVTLVRWHQFSVDEFQTDSAIRRFIRRVGADSIDDMIDLRIGDRLGSGVKKAESWRLKLFKKKIHQVLHPPFSVTDMAVGGHEVMRELGISAGPKVGQILKLLFEEIEEDKLKNTKEELLERLEQMKNEG